MLRSLTFAIGTVLGASGLSSAAAQQGGMLCGDRDQVLQNLEQGYSEAPVSMGLASNGSVIEVLASPKGTFTIIMTQPNGVTCLMVAGESWKHAPASLRESWT